MKKCNTVDDPLCRDDLTIRKTEGTQWQAEMLQ